MKKATRRSTRRRFFEQLEDRRVLATITVTSLADNLTVDAQVTLREAIEAANTNASVDGSTAGEAIFPDTIVFQPGLAGTIDLSGTEYTVSERLTITGPGPDSLTIDAHQLSRHFHAPSNALSFTIEGVTLVRGSIAGNGGAILSEANSLIVKNTVFRDNSATNGGAIDGIAMQLEWLTISGNHASEDGGAIRAHSSPLFGPGWITVTRSAVTGNTAGGAGGALAATGSVGVTIDTSTVSGNTAGTNGGAVAVDSGDVSVFHGTIVDNHANAANGSGGGIYHPDHGIAQLSVQDSILAQNTAAEAPDLTEATEPGFFSMKGISYSIIGNNAGTYLTAAPVATLASVFNVIGEPSAVIDPKLGPLQDNGGNTKTHALLPGSSAIDGGVGIGAGLVDQRGFPRREGSKVDMGAFELTQPAKIADDGITAIWGNNPVGVAESPVPVFWNGSAFGSQSYQAIELYRQVPGTSWYPLIFTDLLANLFSRIAYLRADGAAIPFGTSTVGTVSFRTNNRFYYVPTVTRADITTGGGTTYQSVVTANFGQLANVTTTKTLLSPVVGKSSHTVSVQFNTLQNVSLVNGGRFSSNDRLRLFTASSMFNDETHFDADVLRYEDPQGVIHSLVLKDLTPTNAYVFPSAVEIGSWFELVKTGGSAWYPDSPTIHVAINDKHGLRLGLQGYLLQSTNNNDDSLSVWLEWLDAPNTVTAGTQVNLDLTVTATAPGTRGLSVVESGGDTAVSESGTTDSFSLALNAQPRANVVINVTSGNTVEATVSPSTLTFTPANWDRPQTITVAGVPDGQVDGPQISTITLAVDDPASDVTYRSITDTQVTVTTADVDQPAIPQITWNNPQDINFGTLLDATQLNATATVAGTFEYTPARGALLNAGQNQQLSVTFTPDDTVHYQQVTVHATIHVLQATPVIEWRNPADIRFGAALTAAQLNATVAITGTFVYTPALGTVLNIGDAQTLFVTFTPADTANYVVTTFHVSINVLKAIPVVHWPSPADLHFGTALSVSELNAVSAVPGNFSYSPPLGAILEVGNSQQLSVTFAPADSTSYEVTTVTVVVNVLKAVPPVIWPTPDDITLGTALSATQLNATANLAGTFIYSRPLGTVLDVGDAQTLSVTFKPDDSVHYTETIVTVSINVLRIRPAITWSDPADITYGTVLSATQLNATAAIPGTFAYSPAVGSLLNAGEAQPLSMTFTPDDAVKYSTVVISVAIRVKQAEPIVTWHDPAPIVFGTPLTGAQLNAIANIPGTFVYSPGLGAIVEIGDDQLLTAVFIPDDTTNYLHTTARVSMRVIKATPVIAWSNPADMVFGTVLSEIELNATTEVPGTLVYSPASGTLLNAGSSQELSVTFLPFDVDHYSSVNATVRINVLKANPVITWLAPANITVGTPLGDAQLNATADVLGAFAYTPGPGTILNLGAGQTLTVTFKPDDTINYRLTTAVASINVVTGFDFGDAPTAYPTILAGDGAWHVSSNLFLGNRVDYELDGQPSADASGDAGDEDGVQPITSFLAGGSTATVASVAVKVSGQGKLSAWLDFNHDGDWSDTAEQILTDVTVTPGLNLLSFPIPAGAAPGETFARFRLSSASGLAPTGQAIDGEVEDYRFSLLEGAAAGGAAVQFTAPGVGDLELLADGAEIVLRTGTIELFRARGTLLSRLQFVGSEGNDLLVLFPLSATFTGPVTIDGGLGIDTLRLGGSQHSLDLASAAIGWHGIEQIDLRGTGANTLTATVNDILTLAPFNNTLLVRYDRGDSASFGRSWTIDPSGFLNGEFFQQQYQGGVVVRVITDRPWQNAFQRFDVNRDGVVSPIDVLIPINFLNESGSQLMPPPIEASGIPRHSYDVDGDGIVAPLDVLQVINYLNSQPIGTSSSEGEAAATTAQLFDYVFAFELNWLAAQYLNCSNVRRHRLQW